MSDVVLVAAISAGAALATALLTQFLATRAANRSADRADKREALQWQRTEALRLEEQERKAAEEALSLQRADAQRKLDQQDARLKELWGHVLTARWQVMDALERIPVQGSPMPTAAPLSAQALPAHAAGQAYCVALLGLANVRPSAKAFYAATSGIQHVLQSDVVDVDALEGAANKWTAAYDRLEAAVVALADGLVDPI